MVGGSPLSDRRVRQRISRCRRRRRRRRRARRSNPVALIADGRRMTGGRAEAGSGLVFATVVVDAATDGWRPGHRPVRRLNRGGRLVVEGDAAVGQDCAHCSTAK